VEGVLTAEPISSSTPRSRIAALKAEVRALRQRLAEVETSANRHDSRFRETVERAAAGVAHVSLTGHFLMVNRRLCEMLGYSEPELLKCSFQEITHPDDLGPDLELLGRLTRGEIERFQMEKRYLRPSGEVVWADLTVAMERDEQGQPRNYISVITDIGAHKQNEERLAFLLGELAHRSKNLLTVIQSAVHQIGSDAVSVREFQQAVDDRIHGIAASQDLLVRHEKNGAPVAELVASQLAAFVRPSDPRLRLEGPHLHLGAAATHSLGLALYELATNACKYGALSSENGQVTVEWQVVDGDGERFRMAWTERGGPPVSPPSRHGFGRRVIEQMVGASLGGEVDLCFEPEGLAWRLDAPMPHLQR
jgi:PAS domain S-box-containing protein